jgi:DNA-binding response OmpR family regulator
MPKILVIEDEPQMRLNMLTILEMEGFEALGAEDGRTGVSRARADLPGLILCDIMMPGLDGYGVLRELRADALTARIPFVFLTARGEKGDVESGLAMGAEGYLTKPVVLNDLLAAVRKHLQ